MPSSYEIRIAARKLNQLQNTINSRFTGDLADSSKKIIRVTGELSLFDDNENDTITGDEFGNLQEAITTIKEVLPTLSGTANLYTALANHDDIKALGLNANQLSTLLNRTNLVLNAQLRTDNKQSQSRGIALNGGASVKSKQDLIDKLQGFADYLSTASSVPAIGVLGSPRYNTDVYTNADGSYKNPELTGAEIDTLKADIKALLTSAKNLGSSEFTASFISSKAFAGLLGAAAPTRNLANETITTVGDSSLRASDKELGLLTLAINGAANLSKIAQSKQKQRQELLRQTVIEGKIPTTGDPFSQANIAHAYHLLDYADAVSLDLDKISMLPQKHGSELASFGTQYTQATTGTAEQTKLTTVFEQIYANRNLQNTETNDLSENYTIADLTGNYQAKLSWSATELANRASFKDIDALVPIFLMLNDSRAATAAAGGLSYLSDRSTANIKTELNFYLDLLNKGFKAEEISSAYNFIRLALPADRANFKTILLRDLTIPQ